MLERCNVEQDFEQIGRGQIVQRRIRLELIEEPEPLLCKREWHWTTVQHRNDRRRAESFTVNRVDHRGESVHGRMFEDVAQRQLDAEEIVNARNNLRREE